MALRSNSGSHPGRPAQARIEAAADARAGGGLRRVTRHGGWRVRSAQVRGLSRRPGRGRDLRQHAVARRLLDRRASPRSRGDTASPPTDPVRIRQPPRSAAAPPCLGAATISARTGDRGVPFGVVGANLRAVSAACHAVAAVRHRFARISSAAGSHRRLSGFGPRRPLHRRSGDRRGWHSTRTGSGSACSARSGRSGLSRRPLSSHNRGDVRRHRRSSRARTGRRPGPQSRARRAPVPAAETDLRDAGAPVPPGRDHADRSPAVAS